MPLLQARWEWKLTAMMVIHVDDCAISGKKEMIDEIKNSIAKRLSVKDEGRLSNTSVSDMSGMLMAV